MERINQLSACASDMNTILIIDGRSGLQAILRGRGHSCAVLLHVFRPDNNGLEALRGLKEEDWPCWKRFLCSSLQPSRTPP